MASAPNKVNRRRFLRRAGAGALGMAAGAGLYAWRIEPHWVEVVPRVMRLEGLPERWHGKRLVQISDLHVGPVVSQSYLRSTLQRVVAMRPDIVVVTGDWMTCEDSEQVPLTLEIAGELLDSAPVFGILGNHDYGRRLRSPRAADVLADGLRNRGVRMLRNERFDLDGLQIVGLDDLWARRCRIEETLDGLDPAKPSITLCHNPDAVDDRGWGAYRGWILSGHTHGGQCWAPGVGAPVVPIRNKQYTAGQVDLGGGRWLYVNRAIGYKRRVRFLTRPEITVFDLQPGGVAQATA